MKANGKRACPVCGTLFPDSSESYPVCALQDALKVESGASSIEDGTSELRFEHYREMLSGKLPFQGSGAELMYQQQHAALPMAKLKNVPAPIVMLLEVLLAKDPGQRFQSPAQLRKAVSKVREAIGTGSRLTTAVQPSTDHQLAPPSRAYIISGSTPPG